MRYIMAIVHLSGPEIFETAAALLDFDGIETEHITTDCVHGFVLDMDVYLEKVRRDELHWGGTDYPQEHVKYILDQIYHHDQIVRFLWFVVDA